jgi:hypothetical protein
MIPPFLLMIVIYTTTKKIIQDMERQVTASMIRIAHLRSAEAVKLFPWNWFSQGENTGGFWTGCPGKIRTGSPEENNGKFQVLVLHHF